MYLLIDLLFADPEYNRLTIDGLICNYVKLYLKLLCVKQFFIADNAVIIQKNKTWLIDLMSIFDSIKLLINFEHMILYHSTLRKFSLFEWSKIT